MALKNYNPTTPSLRQLVLVDRKELWKGKPVKTLTEGKHSTGGRNHHGHITTRFRGGGHKRAYRLVDFKRRKWDVVGIVERLEYDPNRTAFIALVRYEDGELAYILAPQRLAAGDKVVAGERVDIKPGNAAPLRSRPVGRHLRPARRPRRRLEPAPARLGRDPPRALGVHGDGRFGLQPGPPEPELRQGRPDALERAPAAQPRRHDEPGRPSARRRRGPHLGRPAPGDPVGSADQGPQDAQEQEDLEHDHPQPPPRQEAGRLIRCRAPSGRARSSTATCSTRSRSCARAAATTSSAPGPGARRSCRTSSA